MTAVRKAMLWQVVSPIWRRSPYNKMEICGLNIDMLDSKNEFGPIFWNKKHWSKWPRLWKACLPNLLLIRDGVTWWFILELMPTQLTQPSDLASTPTTQGEPNQPLQGTTSNPSPGKRCNSSVINLLPRPWRRAFKLTSESGTPRP